MAVTGCDKNFWCVWNECTSYNNGSGCSKCDKYGTCENCVLQGTKNKPDGCADEAYYIQYGYPEEVERLEKQTECTCYREYPNPHEKRKNGKWKCVDCYKCLRPIEYRTTPTGYKRVWRKTKCIKEAEEEE